MRPGENLRCAWTTRTSWRVGAAGVVLVLLAAACGEEPKRRPNRGTAGASGSMSTNLKDGADTESDGMDAIKKAKAKRKKRRQGSLQAQIGRMVKDDPFSDSDFAPNDQDSRDPFRNYLLVTEVAPKENLISATDKRYLENFSYAELKLTGIVGSQRKFAMLLNPRTGRTTIVGRRDRFGKEGALVFRVNRDHIMLLVPSKQRDGKTKEVLVKRYVDNERKIVRVPTEPLSPDKGGIRVYSWRRSRRPRRKER